MCRIDIPLLDDDLLTVIVTEPDSNTTAGHICSTDCLIDYAAKVRELEIGSA